LPDHYFLYIGTLEPRKNIQSIIRAYKANEGRFKGVKLVIAGRKGWMYEEIFKLVREFRLQNDIYFPGYIEDGDVPLLYRGAEAFVFPSLYEGFGMPPLEAMACGVPVITSNTSSLPEVVGDAGLRINPKDIEQLSYAMVKILEDSELRVNCVKKGLERAQNFTWENSAKKVIDIYHELA
jgi:glycosyltransferase involved in cell wall biosynthesis